MKYWLDIKNSFKIFKAHFKQIIIFELIFNAIIVGSLYLISKLIFNFTLKVTGINYLSNTTLIPWLRSPLTIITLILALFLWLFLSLIEITGIIKCYAAVKPMSCFQIFYERILETKKI